MNQAIKNFLYYCIKGETKKIKEILPLVDQVQKDQIDVTIAKHTISQSKNDEVILTILSYVSKNKSSFLLEPALAHIREERIAGFFYKEPPGDIDIVSILNNAIELNLDCKYYYYYLIPKNFNKLKDNVKFKVVQNLKNYDRYKDEFCLKGYEFGPVLPRQYANSVILTGLKHCVLAFKIDEDIIRNEAVKVISNKTKYKYIAVYAKYYDYVYHGRIRKLSKDTLVLPDANTNIIDMKL